ncbi:TetR family transcriptional regulator [Streptomyces antioxidans]|uniref:TetR family transcriptional regulator n=1 Tax=Streptomyces antioxidans TaxID=1507734 RepID=UPI000B0B4926|nr:TetR family transcriptional regulator [Streptomyces antioxidans]
MHQRARSAEDKARRADDLLKAAEALASELGGVRYITLAAVTERAGLHRTGVRRYYASKEELLLELAERGWGQWRDAIKDAVKDAIKSGAADRAGPAHRPAPSRSRLGPAQTAAVVSQTLVALPVFCDLLTHATLYLEGDVDIERARRYKTNSFAAHDEIAATLDHASTMTVEQITSLLAAAIMLAAGLWQVSHPTPTLAALYEQEPRWGHVALDFSPRLTGLLEACAVGLGGT